MERIKRTHVKVQERFKDLGQYILKLSEQVTDKDDEFASMFDEIIERIDTTIDEFYKGEHNYDQLCSYLEKIHWYSSEVYQVADKNGLKVEL